jgi:monovalent cation/hydrogen antiporter
MANAATIVCVVGVAALVSSVTERTRLAVPSVLVVVGYLVTFIPGLSDVRVEPEFVVLALLPPLLFVAADQLPLPELRALARPVAVLAVGLVVVSTAVVAGLATPRIGIGAGIVLGGILASTDPVAVAALSRDLRLPGRLTTLVQAESLFNDATSLLAFQVAVLALVRDDTGLGRLSLDFLQLAGGGIGVGLGVGLLAAWWFSRTSNRIVHVAIAVAAPYAAAVPAYAAGASVVTAVITAGLVVAPRRRSGGPSRLAAARVHERLVFAAENTVFALIGLELGAVLRHLPSSSAGTVGYLVGTAAIALIAVRAITLVAGAVVLRRTTAWRTAAVATWAGARGAIPFVAALSVPMTVDAGGPFPHRDVLVTAAICVTAISVVVQGLTLRPLTRRVFGEQDSDADGPPRPWQRGGGPIRE